jgi:hypothetical protein
MRHAQGQLQRAAGGDLLCGCQSLRVGAEKLRHLSRGKQVRTGRGGGILGQLCQGLDAAHSGHQALQVRLLRQQVVHVVRSDGRQR